MWKTPCEPLGTTTSAQSATGKGLGDRDALLRMLRHASALRPQLEETDCKMQRRMRAFSKVIIESR